LKINPARLSTDESISIYELFTRLFQAAAETSTNQEPVKFLSRFDPV